MYNYENFLIEKLNRVKADLGFDINIDVSSEQAYAKKKNFAPNTLFVVVKYLSSDITFGAKTQPVQVLCISEENALDMAKALLGKFAEDFNFFSAITDGIFAKHQYSTPVVLSNFNEIGIGKRSVLYFTGAINILEDVIDINELKVDNSSIEHLGFNFSYQMTPNTQQFVNDNIAKSIKTTSALTIGFTTPFVENNLTAKVINIINGTNDGNDDFAISFNLGDTPFSNFNYKLTSVNIVTAPDDVPSLRLNFIR